MHCDSPFCCNELGDDYLTIDFIDEFGEHDTMSVCESCENSEMTMDINYVHSLIDEIVEESITAYQKEKNGDMSYWDIVHKKQEEIDKFLTTINNLLSDKNKE